MMEDPTVTSLRAFRMEVALGKQLACLTNKLAKPGVR